LFSPISRVISICGCVECQQLAISALQSVTYVGAVAGSNDQASVEDKLHVASSRSPARSLASFFPSGANCEQWTYSVPAVEMCSLMSDAGQIISALLTL